MEIIKVSEQVTLKRIKIENAAEIFLTIENQREYLGKWLPFVAFTKEQKDTETFINSVISTPEDRFEHVFVIRYEGNFAGIIGYRDTDRTNKKTELGYWLSEPLQGKGIVTKSVKKLIEFTFENLEMNRLVIRCAVKNENSKKIPRVLNFKFEGIERAGELLSDGTYTDLEVYSLLRCEVN